MSTQATKKDIPLMADGPVFHLWDYCPYPSCGEPTNVEQSERFCGQCGFVFNVCPNCRATNRLLASFCRGCGQRLESTAWPMEAGLHSDWANRSSIRSLADLRSPFPVRLSAGVAGSPIAADGLLVIAQTDGRVSLWSEHTGEQIGFIPVTEQIIVTPALHHGTLFVAAGRRVFAFDLTEFIDQPSLQQVVPVWAHECAGKAVTQPLLVDEKAVYVLSHTGEGATLDAISQQHGQSLWPTPLQFQTDHTTTPVLVDGQVIVITLEGEVSVVQSATGQISQTFSLDRRIDPQVSPFVFENRIFLSDPHGYVFQVVLDRSGPLINGLCDHGSRISSLSANEQFIVLCHMAGVTLLSSRGNPLWSSDTMESVSASPIIAGESVFVIDDAGNGLLFETLKSNPIARVKLLSEEVGPSPLMTPSHIVVVSAEGMVAAIQWQ